MFEKHKSVITPDRDLIIWRYMDLWKFLDIVDNKKLYLARADTFEDKFEGRIANRKIRDLDDNHPLKKIDDYSEFALKKHTYISCWTCYEDEDYALWKIYSDYKTAIAIKTTVGKLIDSISDEKSIQRIGVINYSNRSSGYVFRGNTYQLFFEKRKYFSFEYEIRVLTELMFDNYEELLKLPLGTSINIKPEILINEIYLAPLADENLKNLIELKLKELDLKIPVRFSDI